jgi:hypothetical protein
MNIRRAGIVSLKAGSKASPNIKAHISGTGTPFELVTQPVTQPTEASDPELLSQHKAGEKPLEINGRGDRIIRPGTGLTLRGRPTGVDATEDFRAHSHELPTENSRRPIEPSGRCPARRDSGPGPSRRAKRLVSANSWSGRQDSNLRHLRPKRSALPV